MPGRRCPPAPEGPEVVAHHSAPRATVGRARTPTRPPGRVLQLPGRRPMTTRDRAPRGPRDRPAQIGDSARRTADTPPRTPAGMPMPGSRQRCTIRACTRTARAAGKASEGRAPRSTARPPRRRGRAPATWIRPTRRQDREEHGQCHHDSRPSSRLRIPPGGWGVGVGAELQAVVLGELRLAVRDRLPVGSADHGQEWVVLVHGVEPSGDEDGRTRSIEYSSVSGSTTVPTTGSVRSGVRARPGLDGVADRQAEVSTVSCPRATTSARAGDRRGASARVSPPAAAPACGAVDAAPSTTELTTWFSPQPPRSSRTRHPRWAEMSPSPK